MLDVALEKKVVQKAGSYFSFGDERLGQGRQNATNFLVENPDLVQQILGRIQAEAPEEQVISARLLPTQSAEGAPSAGNGGDPGADTIDTDAIGADTIEAEVEEAAAVER